MREAARGDTHTHTHTHTQAGELSGERERERERFLPSGFEILLPTNDLPLGQPELHADDYSVHAGEARWVGAARAAATI